MLVDTVFQVLLQEMCKGERQRWIIIKWKVREHENSNFSGNRIKMTMTIFISIVSSKFQNLTHLDLFEFNYVKGHPNLQLDIRNVYYNT